MSATTEQISEGFVSLSAACKCLCPVGRIELRKGRYAVSCADCGTFLREHKPPVKLDSRYAGKCRACKVEHRIGDYVWWTPGTPGVQCKRCAER